MDREGFRNRLKQYKKAREENPGLKYWEWKSIPKYDEGTDAVMGPITYDEWIRQLRKKPNIVENEDDEKLIQLIRKKSKNFLYLRNRTNEQGMIPFIEEKAITLSNAGKDTGVRLSTNMLDSIAKYADKADISLQDALGLAGQESTFGKGYFLDQSAITPSVLVSDWSYSDDMLSVDRTENPYVGLMRAAQQKHDSGGYDKSGRFIIYNPDYIKALRGGLPFADKEAKRLRTDIPVLEHAFRKYKSGLYNPNDPNHTRMVEERGKALMKSPEILKWIKESKFIPENKINFAEGGEVTEEGGWTEDYWSKANREAAHKDLDPTMRFSPETLLFDNGATGEENEYWKAYLGLDNTVPKMNKNAYTEWDMQIEAEKKKNGELLSDFYGTTPNMDLSLQAVADTLYLGKLSREYDMYSKTYEDLPSKKEIDSLYKQSKQVMDNPGKWQQMYSDENIIKRTSDKDHGEINPLGMLAHYGMKWVPEENALYVHDTYDFPWYARWAGKIKERPEEMKIRSKIEFNPKKGSKLLRSAENYNNAYK